jgi:hypothetical protein
MFPQQIIWSRGYGCDLKDCARLKQTLEKEEHGIWKVLIGLNKFSNKMYFVWVGNHKLKAWYHFIDKVHHEIGNGTSCLSASSWRAQTTWYNYLLPWQILTSKDISNYIYIYQFLFMVRRFIHSCVMML